MSVLGYLRFKLGRWVGVGTVPEWVHEANDGYYEGYINKYGHRPYDVEKVYTGENLEYKIVYNTVAQGKIELKYYVKIR